MSSCCWLGVQSEEVLVRCLVSCHEPERDCCRMFRWLIIVKKGFDFQCQYFTVDCDLEILSQHFIFLFR